MSRGWTSDGPRGSEFDSKRWRAVASIPWVVAEQWAHPKCVCACRARAAARIDIGLSPLPKTRIEVPRSASVGAIFTSVNCDSVALPGQGMGPSDDEPGPNRFGEPNGFGPIRASPEPTGNPFESSPWTGGGDSRSEESGATLDHPPPNSGRRAVSKSFFSIRAIASEMPGLLRSNFRARAVSVIPRGTAK